MNDTSPNIPVQTPPRPRRHWLRTIIVSLVLLGSGAAIGSGLTLIILARGLQFGIRHPELFPERATHRLQSFLDLSSDQASQVEAILQRHQRELQVIRREVQPRIESHVDQIRDEISAVLTPEQARKWRRWLNDKRATWLPPPPASTPEP